MNKNFEITALFPAKLIAQLLLTLMLAMLSPMLLAKCEQPEPPVIPTNEEMSSAKMAAVQDNVEAYMSAAKEYLGCTRRKNKRDATVDEMRLVAANYNVLIQFYREYRDEQ